MTITHRIGKLRHKVLIQADGSTRDAHNQITPSWSTISGGTVWANVEPLRGKGLHDADMVQTEITHKVTMRYLSTVTEKHRIVHDSRNLQIIHVINVDESDWILELMCKEIT